MNIRKSIVAVLREHHEVKHIGALADDLESALETLQRETEEKSAWIKSATIEITKAIGGGSEMFTPHGDEFRVDPAFVASFIQYRRERHAESKKASIQKERELIARAEAAEAEVKRLITVVQTAHVAMTLAFHMPGVAEEYDFSDAIAATFQALASTGGEHHAE